MKIGIAVGVVIAALAFVVCLVPLKWAAHELTIDYEDTESYCETEPLEYRELDSFTTEGVNMDDVSSHAAMRGYDLPDEIVGWPDFAVYVVVQNLDDVSGTFEIRYTLTTADKEAAERQMWIIQRTPEEYEELDREYYEGSIELNLEPSEIGVAICPPEGIHIASDRVPFDHSHQVIPDTKVVEKERIVTKQRLEITYKKVTLLDYLLHY